MRVVICGAGKVGTSIARHLVEQKNDVTVVDQSSDLINELRDKVDLKTIIGSASNPSVLQQAGCDEADMLIAVTLQDEINMVACQMAHTFFKVPRKIARIRSEDFLDPIWRNLYNADNMPIDLIISPELEVAKSIERQIKAPGAYDHKYQLNQLDKYFEEKNFFAFQIEFLLQFPNLKKFLVQVKRYV